MPTEEEQTTQDVMKVEETTQEESKIEKTTLEKSKTEPNPELTGSTESPPQETDSPETTHKPNGESTPEVAEEPVEDKSQCPLLDKTDELYTVTQEELRLLTLPLDIGSEQYKML